MRLDLVVGPNGAGKSTFIRTTLLPALPPGVALVDADRIAQQRWADEAEARSYEAARIAGETRQALIAALEPFIAETVFSHPSKLDLITSAQQVGFTVALHVVLIPEELAVARVAHRVAAGGHAVPEAKIRARYQRLWPLVRRAMDLADVAGVYDNSAHAGPRLVLQLVGGMPVGVARWPTWAPPISSGKIETSISVEAV